MNPDSFPYPAAPDFIAGGGDAGARMRAFDWRTTPLGPPERWPYALRTAVRIALTSRQPMWIGWGPELTFICNDAQSAILGGRNAWALGRPSAQVWDDVWQEISPNLSRALRDGEGAVDARVLVSGERDGRPTASYWTFAYSPVPDDSGRPGGVLCVTTDETDRVLRERERAPQGAPEWASDRSLARAGGRILVVEDDADMRAMLAELLAPAHQVLTARDGEEALAVVRERHPDLVLTDMLMPRMSGADLLRRMREDVTLADIPVIVLSARAGEDARVEGLAAGADDCIDKPFAARELLARVDTALTLARTRARTRELLADEAQLLETLNHVGRAVAGELDLPRVMQTVTDAATALTGAAAGALYCVADERDAGSRWLVVTSGPSRGCFARLPLPPVAPLFAATVRDRAIVRRDALAPGEAAGVCPASPGEPPIRSYLAVPVLTRSGEVAGALVFVHPDAARFDERTERLATGIALQAAAAIDNARLYESAQREIAERKRVEAALRASEERFRLATQGAKVGIWDWDVARDVVVWSESLYAIHGVAGDGYDGTIEGFLRFVHPDDRERVAQSIAATLERDARYEVEFRALRPDGTAIWLSTEAGLVRDERGRPLRMLGAVIDVTARKRAELALREREASYRQLVEALPIAVYVCDASGRVVLWNNEGVTLWGHPPENEEMAGAGYRMFDGEGRRVAPDERPLARALRGETGLACLEATIERPDGARRHVIVYAQAIRDDAGRIIGGIKVMVDITERKVAEAELAATKDHFAVQVAALTRLHELATRLAGTQELEPALDAVLETLVAITGADFGLLTLHEPEAGRLRAVASRGFTPAQLGRVECVQPGMGACGQSLVTRSRTVVEDVRTDPLFAPLRAFAAEVGIRAVHSTPILNRAGEVLGVLSVLAREPRRPTPLETQFADMCARYAAGTIELIRSQQSLRDADRRKDEFLATLAHELRNPLAPIRNALHVIKMAGDDSRAIAETRGIIERQLQQMVRLVDDLLDVSRISRGKIELRRENVDLARVIQSAVETSDALVKQHGHTLSIELPAEQVVLHADHTRLAQVFSNLVNNAAKYTPPGGNIRIGAVRRDGTVQVAVRDDGIGIPPELLPAVFDMFTQVDSSLERAGGGLGVGLTIVKRLVEMHGGSIEARSEGKGKGSEFIVTLPAEDAGALPAEDAAVVPAGVARPRRIMVVDDNVDLATTLARMLSMMGNAVETVHDGAAAIEATDRFRPEVIFLDIGMPKMNGYEACRRIRERPAGRDVMIVALSGWGQEHDKQRSMQAGMDLHLVKPIDPAALDSLLARLPAKGGEAARQSAPSLQDEVAGAEPSRADAQPAERQERGPVVSLAERMRAAEERPSIEATRFALFRRLAPSLRHDLVGELQGIRFAVDLAQRQLRQRTGEPAMGESLERVASQTQEALKSGDAILEWLRPEGVTSKTVRAAIEECLGLVRTDWSMRGIEVRVSLPAAERSVAAHGFREVLAASLFALSDALRTPADVEVVVADDGPAMELSIAARVAAREAFAPTPVSRAFGWDEVQALARADGVDWSRQELRISMRIPGATALAA